MPNPTRSKVPQEKRYTLTQVLGWLEGNDPPPLEEIKDIHDGKARVRKDFVKEIQERLRLLTPLEAVKLAKDHPVYPGEPGWEGRFAELLKACYLIVKHR